MVFITEQVALRLFRQIISPNQLSVPTTLEQPLLF